MSKRIVVVTVVCGALALSAYGREGFGFTKKGVEIQKTIPPGINVQATRVNVAVDTENTRVTDKAQTLRTYTEEAILAGDKRLQASSPADVTVTIKLDRFDTEKRRESKVDYDYVKSKDKNGKTVYNKVPKTTEYTISRGEIEGTYKITDAKGRLLESGDVDRKFEQKNEYVVPTDVEMQEDLLRGAARKIAARIVPTKQKMNTLLPKGSFEQLIPLAESGAWDRYLQGVESVRPLNDRAADAYRQYALGVAKEAAAYGTGDPKQALELLRAAAGHYRTAAADNPNERLFSEAYSSLFSAAAAPVARAEASVKAYEAWTSGPTAPMASSVMASSTKSASRAAAMQNQKVIDMAKAGLPDENIILAIESADTLDFDTSPDGLIALSKAGVSKNVITHMQKRTRK
jgi:hypothetical protein